MEEIRRLTLDDTGLRQDPEPGVRVTRLEQGDIPVHDHLFHEIVLVESGAAVHLTVEGERPLRPGDVIVLRPQVWHAYRQTRKLVIINCLIDSRVIHRHGSLLAQAPGTLELYRRRSRQGGIDPPAVVHARPAQRGAILARLEAMMAERAQQHPGWIAALTVGVLDLLVQVARLTGTQTGAVEPTPVTRADRAVLEAVSYIEQHYTQDIRLAEIARRVHLSTGHLSRSFGRRMGMSLPQFVHRLRAEEACRLLHTTGQSISDIAGALGYDELAYFSRCFREAVGRSPRQYRQGPVPLAASIS